MVHKKSNKWPRGGKGFDPKKSKTPKGNTGVPATQQEIKFESYKGLEALVDWIQGTFPEKNYRQIKRLIESYFNDKFSKSSTLRFYKNSERTTKGVVLADSPRQGGAVKKRVDAYLEINAQCLATLSPQLQQELFRDLDELEFRPSRIDLTIDDYKKSLRPRTLYNAYLKGNVVGFRSTATWHQSGPPDATAGTFSIGKRGNLGSGKYFQCYDKFLESNGEVDAVRFELRLSQAYGREAFSSLLDSDWRRWDTIIGGYISGAIDFVDKSKSPKNIKRCPRLRFWSIFINRFPALRFRTRVKKIKTIEEVEDWLVKQVFPSLSTFMECHLHEFGFDSWHAWFYQNIFSAGDRRNPHQENLVKLSKMSAESSYNHAYG